MLIHSAIKSINCSCHDTCDLVEGIVCVYMCKPDFVERKKYLVKQTNKGAYKGKRRSVGTFES